VIEKVIIMPNIKRRKSSAKGKSPCWKGYKKAGMKKKGNKMVPNCIPEKDS
jgi:hypothetical protein